MPKPHLLYAEPQRKYGGGYVRRHWALLISDDRVKSIRCEVDNAPWMTGGKMIYVLTTDLDLEISRTDDDKDRIALGVELSGDPESVLDAIQAVETPEQKRVNFELLPDC